MLTVACSGGIGDGLRNLSLVPHEALHRLLGVRYRVVFFQIAIMEGDVARPGTGLAHANFPCADLFRNLVDRCPSLGWVGEMEKVGLGLMVNRALREIIKLSHKGQPRYFPFSPSLTKSEMAVLPVKGAGPLIGIQTHLSGMRTKQWGVEKWRELLRLLLQNMPDARLVLLDVDPAVAELATSTSITTTLGFDIAQSIRLVPRLDLLISVDSWSKYIAAAHRVPQVIIVPDQQSEYPEFKPKNFVEKSFAGLIGDPTVTLLGLTSNPPALTLPSLAELAPERLVDLARSTLSSPRKAPLSGG